MQTSLDAIERYLRVIIASLLGWGGLVTVVVGSAAYLLLEMAPDAARLIIVFFVFLGSVCLVTSFSVGSKSRKSQ